MQTLHLTGEDIHSDINHSERRHSCPVSKCGVNSSRNPERHQIPGQARNDKPYETYVNMYV